MSDDLAPHTSGYMKPPKSERFKKGKSGNPKGGPKVIDNPSTVITKVLARRVTVSGTGQRVTMLDALTYKLRELALAGDNRAVKLAAAILKVATNDQRGRFEQEDREAYANYRKRRQEIWESIGVVYPDHLKEDDECHGYR